MVIGEARNDPSLQPAHAEDPTPILAVDAHRGPAVGPILAELCAGMLLDGALELRGIELRVLEVGPDAADVGGVGGDAQAQAAVHVGAQLELRRLLGAARGEGQLGEAVGDGLELQQRRQLDVHVGLPDLGLHDHLHRLGVEDAHGNVLRDDLFVLAPERRLEVLLLEDAVVVIAKRVVARRGSSSRCCGGSSDGGLGPGRGGVGGGGGDGHGEDGQAVLLGEAQGGGDAVEGGLEGALQRL